MSRVGTFRPPFKEVPMFRSDDDDIKWLADGETAPLGGGPVDPIPAIDNPNAD